MNTPTSRKKFLPPLALFIAALLFLPASSSAQSDQGKLSITIAPPLYQLTIAPGTRWQSTLRVVNTNHYPLSVHADVADFHPDGETGNAVFDTLTKGNPNDTRKMSGWIELPSGDILIPADQSYEIPIAISVPKNADPGGHYGAIMVGTLPPDRTPGESGASVGTTLSSLIFLRVPGEVVEEGLIRDFYTEKDIVQSPNQTFVLRFENKGNVHLVPQGAITITNMWGKVRGSIVVNEKSSFGNVLPGSTRKFAFEWKGEPSLFDIGRYSVEAILSFGEANKQSAVRLTHFWIIPWKPVSATFFAIIFLIWFFTWSLRRYVRKALELERSHYMPAQTADQKGTNVSSGAPVLQNTIRPGAGAPRITVALLKQPLIQGATALPRRGTLLTPTSSRAQPQRAEGAQRSRTYIEWAKQYRLFILFIFVFILATTLVGYYFVEVFQEERGFQVTEIRPRG